MKEYLCKKTQNKREYLICLTCIFLYGVSFGVLTIINIGIDIGIVSGSSMNNTLIDGTKTLYVSKDIKQIKRRDIINFYGYLDGELINVVKRVIGLPGETIFINGANVYINGKLLEEPYAIYTHPTEDYMEVKVKENEYFVMGDNRSTSDDSRCFGTIPKKNILGVLIKSKPPKRHILINSQ